MLHETPSPSLIAEGSRLQGDLTFQSITHVYGAVEGNLLQQSLEPLVIGKTGWIKGSISSRGPVVIEGRVDGNVFSATVIQLKPTGSVNGTVVASSVRIESGSCLNGEIIMHWPAQQGDLVHAAA